MTDDLTAFVPLNRPCLALLLLSLGATASAQTAPANVVTPAPPPREGTVGPEQLRDFSLPGTRATPAPAPTPTPAPRQDQAPPGGGGPPARAPQRQSPAADATPQSSRVAPPRSVGSRTPAAATATPRTADPSPTPAPNASTSTGEQVAVDLGTPVLVPEGGPPAEAAIDATEAETDRSSLITAATRFWWAWLLLAGLVGAALAFNRRQRTGRREELTGAFAPVPAPAAPVPEPVREPAPVPRTRVSPQPAPAPSPPPPHEPPLPGGLVTTRLRSRPQAQPGTSAAPIGAVISTGLRPWLELDLAMSEIALLEAEAVLRFRLTLLNSGTAEARDIVIEAVALNAGETQGAEIASFYERPAPAAVGVAQLGRLAVAELAHEVRMPRSAIREYSAGGRRLFVPVLAFNASYRWHSGEGRTSAAFLAGHQQPGAERLAPLRLDEASGRLIGFGVRRLDEQIRR